MHIEIDEPLVTVILVSYNQGKFIDRCVQSISDQTHKNIQLIICDDASSDDSVQQFEAAIKKYKLKALKNFHQKNTGLAKILNECFPLIDGKYVKMLACDDYLTIESLKLSIAALEMGTDDLAVVYGRMQGVDDSGKYFAHWTEDYYQNNEMEKEFYDKLMKNPFIGAPSVLLKTKVLLEMGHYREDLLHEDYYMWLKIAQKYTFLFIPEILAYKTSHDEQITTSRRTDILVEALIIRILFDPQAKYEKYITYSLIEKYYKSGFYKNPLWERLIEEYKEYAKRNEILLFCMSKSVPFWLYRYILVRLRYIPGINNLFNNLNRSSL